VVSLEVYSLLTTQPALVTQSQAADLSIKDVQSSFVTLSTLIREFYSRHRFLLLIASWFCEQIACGRRRAI